MRVRYVSIHTAWRVVSPWRIGSWYHYDGSGEPKAWSCDPAWAPAQREAAQDAPQLHGSSTRMTLLRAFSLLLVSGSGASRGDLVGGLEPRVAWLLRLQTRPLWSSGPFGVNCSLPLPRKSACPVRNGWSGVTCPTLAPRRARGWACLAGLPECVCRPG